MTWFISNPGSAAKSDTPHWADLRHVLGPLHARAAAPFAYANDRFSSAVAALEAYHRYCVATERELERRDHRLRVAELGQTLDAHAPHLSNWAVNAARPFNKIPLWKRLVDILEVLPLISSSLIGADAAEVKLFARAVESARHGHAHALGDPRSIDSGEDLYFAADALVWILRACVMVDLALPLDLVEQRIVEHERFRRTASAVRELIGGLPR